MKRKIGNKGIAMTEIIVAFLMLLICLAMLNVCMTLSSNLLHKSKEIDLSYTNYGEKLAEMIAGSNDDVTAVFNTEHNGQIEYKFSGIGNKTITVNTGTLNIADETIPIYSTKP